MPGTTSRGYPYPLGPEQAIGSTDIQALGEAVDADVTSLDAHFARTNGHVNIVASHAISGNPLTGALWIELPTVPGTPNLGMMHVVFRGYNYNGDGKGAEAWTLSLGCYAYSTGWTAASAHLSGLLSRSNEYYRPHLRWYAEGTTGHFAIQIGDVAQNWYYPSVAVELYRGYNTPETVFTEPWTVNYSTAIDPLWAAQDLPVAMAISTVTVV